MEKLDRVSSYRIKQAVKQRTKLDSPRNWLRVELVCGHVISHVQKSKQYHYCIECEEQKYGA